MWGFGLVLVFGFFLIKGQVAFCLISTSQEVGEYFTETPSQIFSPRVHLTNFRGKWPCLYQLLCFCYLTKIKDPVRLLIIVSHRRTVWSVTISHGFLQLEATQPCSCRKRQSSKGQKRDLYDGTDLLHPVDREEQEAQPLPSESSIRCDFQITAFFKDAAILCLSKPQ